MGYDQACTARIDGRSGRGTASLEQKALIFRGPFRLTIPLAEVAAARADGGTLHVSFGTRTAEFDIGTAAAKWAQRITSPPTRLAKLGMKPGMRVAVRNVEDPALVAELEALGVEVAKRPSNAGALDAIFVGAASAADLERLASYAKVIQPAGAIWVIRRKGRDATLSEAESMAAGKRAGLVDVKVVSFSDTHSAEKYVIPRASRAVTPRKAAR